MSSLIVSFPQPVGTIQVTVPNQCSPLTPGLVSPSPSSPFTFGVTNPSAFLITTTLISSTCVGTSTVYLFRIIPTPPFTTSILDAPGTYIVNVGYTTTGGVVLSGQNTLVIPAPGPAPGPFPPPFPFPCCCPTPVSCCRPRPVCCRPRRRCC